MTIAERDRSDATQALRDSIADWDRKGSATDPAQVRIGHWNCPLCALYYAGGCYGCPIEADTHATGCDGTPFGMALNAHIAWQRAHATGKREAEARAVFHYRAAQMRDYLQRLLDRRDNAQCVS